MDTNEVLKETGLMDPSGGGHSGHQDWVTTHHYSETHHGMENVVQIIVPELSCLGQATPDNSLANTIHHVPSSVGLVGTTANGAIISGTLRSASLNEVKDSLSALATVAEMDQVRSDVLQQVENIMDESKYIEITTNDIKPSGVIAHVVDKPSGTILHTYNFEPKLHQNPRQLQMATFLDANDSDSVFYNEIYHFLYSGTFPEGVSEVYKKVVKKRATNYMINENGTLSYGSNNPKQVLTSRQAQKQLLLTTHIDKETRVHNGVRKMYSLIFAKYYWRSLYVDVGNMVRSCESCSETCFHAEEEPAQAGQELAPVPSNVNLPRDRVMRVWKRVQVKIHGPYKKTIYGNEFIISIVDPFSKWILARPSLEGNLENNCANFIFESFCTYGFAQCQVVGLSCESFEAMQGYYREKFDSSQDVLRGLVPFDSEDAQHSFMFTLQEKSTECHWADELFDEMCSANPDTWDDEVTLLLFHFSTTKPANGGPSPFAIMFARGPTGYVSEDEKENINILEEEKALEVPVNRRRLRSSTLQCRHCHETFTSKISFRIHQRKHTEEARRRGTMEGEKRLVSALLERKSLIRNKKRRRTFHRGERLLPMSSLNWSELRREVIPNGIRQQLTQSTVEAVRNLLMATKEERSKRGKYFKYTPELRDEIAQYALDHSIPAATTYWSSRLGNTVSESSIRNFIKNYKSFSIETKEEIGKYAFNHGIERAVVHFSEKFGFEIRKGIVLKFKKFYMKKFYDGNQSSEFTCETSGIKRSNASTRQKRSFSFQMKDEIGRFANIHGIPAAMDHFSVKLQFPVKESTVRKFRRQNIERNGSLSNQGRNGGGNEGIVQDTVIMGDQQNDTHGGMDVLHPLQVLNSSNIQGTTGINVSSANNFIYQHSYPLNITPGSTQGNTTVIPMNHNSLTFHQGSVINQGVTSLAYQQQPPTVIMNQPFSHVGPSTFQQSYVNNFSQPGATSNAGQGTPLSIAHTSVSSSMVHNNSPLQLTMGGSHLGQVNSVSVAPTHHLGLHNPQVGHSSTHHPQQLITSNYHQHMSGNLSFEAPIDHQVSLNNEPLSLMKDTSHGVEVMQQQHGGSVHPNNTLHDSSINVTTSINGIQASIIHITNSHVLEPSIHTVSPPQHLQTQLQNQDSSSPNQNEPQPALPEVDSGPDEQDVNMESDNEEDYSEPPTPRKKRSKSKSSRHFSSVYTCGKRGNYVSYSPELRAEIGKYAAEHGNLAAITYFRDKMGVDIPESTVRGLKDKYMIKRMRGEKDVKSLGFAQRGRPMRLGKYDAIVQECMKELLKSGEKVSSFLVIATAKQVLMQYEPLLLEENGGPVKLNPTWAKSFLKRIGLSHLS